MNIKKVKLVPLLARTHSANIVQIKKNNIKPFAISEAAKADNLN